MFSKFLNLSKEKQERIINAAMKEFSQKGFANASTNEIVKEAGISKGILFHYFMNKKGLFLFLYDYLIETMLAEFFTKINFDEKDLLMKYRTAIIVKFDLIQKHPDMFHFIKIAYEETSFEIKNELEKRNNDTIASSYQKMFSNIDTTKFKDEIDVQRAINIVIWTMEGFSNQYNERTKAVPLDQINMDELLAEIDQYLDALRIALYK